MPQRPPVPCPCPRCKGALVSPSTLSRHRKEFKSTGRLPEQVQASSVRAGGGTLGSDTDVPRISNDLSRRQTETTEIAGGSAHTPVDYDDYNMNESIPPSPKSDEREQRMNLDESGSEIDDLNNDHPSDDDEGPSEPPVTDQGSIGDLEDATARAAAAQADAERLEAMRAQAAREAEEAEARQRDDDPIRPPDDLFSNIESINITQKFIDEIQRATLDNGNLDEDTIARLRHPIEGPVDISDPDTRLSLDIFLAVTNASEQTYDSVRAAVILRYPDTKILSYHLVKKLVADISGVVSVVDDMCIKSCLAFTGPFADDNICSICGEHRYDQLKLQLTGKNIPRQQFHTIPLGPQLQALRRSPDGSAAMGYRDKKTREVMEMIQTIQSPDDMVYDDIFCGTEYLSLYEAAGLTSNDTVAAISMDGVQLYQNKASDMWLYIWIIEDVVPGTRYKKKRVLPGGFIPGPLKPKILDSFIFRGIHHVSALQRENNGRGMRIWDACLAAVIYSRIIFAMGTADAMGMPEMDGEVGHHGALGCRLRCKMKGRHKPHAGHYFMPHLQPLNYTVPDCNHPDIDIRSLQTGSAEDYWHDLQVLISSRDQADYERNCKATGLSKPSIFTGLVPSLMFPIPRCWVLDLMHLIKLNIPELLITLWRGTIKCESTDNKNTWPWRTLVGNTWIEHGKSIAACRPYFPTSFGED